MNAAASLPFEATNETGETGLVGTITVKVEDNDGGVTLGPTTADITELGATGIYVWNAPAAPASLGSYTLVWSTDGSFDPDTVSSEELVVLAPDAIPTSPLPTPEVDGTSTNGPCSGWLTGEDVAECCNADIGTAYVLLDNSADVASQLLFEASGRRWAGLCSLEDMRPCHGGCSCGVQILSRGHIVVDPYLTSYHTSCEGRSCGCNEMSRVPLAGYVRQVAQVKLDGVVVDSSVYRVDEHKWLTRVDGGRWPSCSHHDRASTEEGTFSVNYTYGKTPPLAGIEAAKALACQIYKRCDAAASGGDCEIPEGAVRITRQGITVERAFFRWTREEGWATGITAVDEFLNIYNPRGLARRAVFTGPGSRRRYARPVG